MPAEKAYKMCLSQKKLRDWRAVVIIEYLKDNGDLPQDLVCAYMTEKTSEERGREDCDKEATNAKK